MSLPARSFAVLLTELEDGQFHDDLSKAIQDLVGDLENVAADQGGKPSASLNLSISLTRDSGVIEIKADFTVKRPKLKRMKSLFWPTKDNHLSRENPRQQKLPFREVSEDRETRTV